MLISVIVGNCGCSILRIISDYSQNLTKGGLRRFPRKIRKFRTSYKFTVCLKLPNKWWMMLKTNTDKFSKTHTQLRCFVTFELYDRDNNEKTPLQSLSYKNWHEKEHLEKFLGLESSWIPASTNSLLGFFWLYVVLLATCLSYWYFKHFIKWHFVSYSCRKHSSPNESDTYNHIALWRFL